MKVRRKIMVIVNDDHAVIDGKFLGTCNKKK